MNYTTPTTLADIHSTLLEVLEVAKLIQDHIHLPLQGISSHTIGGITTPEVITPDLEAEPDSLFPTPEDLNQSLKHAIGGVSVQEATENLKKNFHIDSPPARPEQTKEDAINEPLTDESSEAWEIDRLNGLVKGLREIIKHELQGQVELEAEDGNHYTHAQAMECMDAARDNEDTQQDIIHKLQEEAEGRDGLLTQAKAHLEKETIAHTKTEGDLGRALIKLDASEAAERSRKNQVKTLTAVAGLDQDDDILDCKTKALQARSERDHAKERRDHWMERAHKAERELHDLKNQIYQHQDTEPDGAYGKQRVEALIKMVEHIKDQRDRWKPRAINAEAQREKFRDLLGRCEHCLNHLTHRNTEATHDLWKEVSQAIDIHEEEGANDEN